MLSKRFASQAGRLDRRLRSLAGRTDTHLFHSLQGLSLRLIQPMAKDPIVVLVAGDRQELREFFGLGRLLQRFRVVLILPDRDPETLRLGYQLAPRFISYLDGDLSDARAVIAQMQQNDLNRFFTGMGQRIRKTTEDRSLEPEETNLGEALPVPPKTR
jgi:hypothetical protein